MGTKVGYRWSHKVAFLHQRAMAKRPKNCQMVVGWSRPRPISDSLLIDWIVSSASPPKDSATTGMKSQPEDECQPEGHGQEVKAASLLKRTDDMHIQSNGFNSNKAMRSIRPIIKKKSLQREKTANKTALWRWGNWPTCSYVFPLQRIVSGRGEGYSLGGTCNKAWTLNHADEDQGLDGITSSPTPAWGGGGQG